ncbi:FHA domain-containing protein [Nostoc sp. FACHB-152]|uniref:FHA domain-containing protein n=1 Tax=unclassified Nostoc TaxID=2593658 RepID=UPI0016884A9E|nr:MULTISPECIES: FHA domain-containing protein [unclassified Nostoc]MBD2449727.1 FHA domain-containing protein [Nostoc sp. FACHB-152]MBD2469896.1 FHA domain-containing protein [Nostoc sp. FACHB-145]
MTVNRCPNPNCEYFNRTLPNNAKVCPMCGTLLGNVVVSTPTVDNQPAPVEQPAVVPASTSLPPAPIYTSPSSTRSTLRLIHTSGKEFTLLGEDGYIGRRNFTNKSTPEIDLTGIANEKVVSRSHARIYWDKAHNAYMLIDNQSRNGTYLNGNFLAPGTSYRLNHNDSLELGQEKLICFTVNLT